MHPARHTYGALLRASGVARDDQEEYLGHSRPGVTSRYTSAIEIDVRDADNAAKLATYLKRVSTRDRIEQLDAPVSTTGQTADDVARKLVERYGADALAKVAELMAIAT